MKPLRTLLLLVASLGAAALSLVAALHEERHGLTIAYAAGFGANAMSFLLGIARVLDAKEKEEDDALPRR